MPSTLLPKSAMLLGLILLQLALLNTASGAESALIELTDGSTLRGQVQSLKGGTYEIRTQSLGVVRIPQDDVVLVTYGAAKPQAQAGSAQLTGVDPGSAVASLQSQLSKNPETVQLIMGLSEDPDVQAVLQDPSIQAAIRGGDFSALLNDPKMKALMSHPTIRKITAGAAGAPPN